ncbi:hypothetical protein GGR56DRAFT_674305 [Xylariaceae sp. FL0804]|nr:hypothetical protein GGR56DRAFT_674305 [Xylariaceae sp. FL0804]
MSADIVRLQCQDALAAAGPPPGGAPFGWNSFWEGEPPVAFFTDPPKHAPAIFSTKNGTRAFRHVPNPTRERDGHWWHAAEIHVYCDELRHQHFGTCKYIQPVADYWDLYRYFDALEIYEKGAQNLWNVINRLLHQNQYILQDLINDVMPMIEEWAVDLLSDPQICKRLADWNPSTFPNVLSVFSPYELREIEGLDDWYSAAICNVLSRHHVNLRNGHGVLPTVFTPPSHIMPLFDWRRDGSKEGTSHLPTEPEPRAESALQVVSATFPCERDVARTQSAPALPGDQRYSSAPSVGGDPTKVLINDPFRDAEPSVYHGVQHTVGGHAKSPGTGEEQAQQRPFQGPHESAPEPTSHNSGKLPSMAGTQLAVPQLCEQQPFEHQLPFPMQPPAGSFPNPGQQLQRQPPHPRGGHGHSGGTQRSLDTGTAHGQGNKHRTRLSSSSSSQYKKLSPPQRSSRHHDGGKERHDSTDFECRNKHKTWDADSQFEACPCRECQERDRSIYVKKLPYNFMLQAEAAEHIKTVFGRFGYIEKVSPRFRFTARDACVVQFAAPHFALSAVNEMHDIAVPYLGVERIYIEADETFAGPSTQQSHESAAQASESPTNTGSSSPVTHDDTHGGKGKGKANALNPQASPFSAAPESSDPIHDHLTVEGEDEEAELDYGTVRVRPGRAKYVPVRDLWQNAPEPDYEPVVRDFATQHFLHGAPGPSAPVGQMHFVAGPATSIEALEDRETGATSSSGMSAPVGRDDCEPTRSEFIEAQKDREEASTSTDDTFLLPATTYKPPTSDMATKTDQTSTFLPRGEGSQSNVGGKYLGTGSSRQSPIRSHSPAKRKVTKSTEQAEAELDPRRHKKPHTGSRHHHGGSGDSSGSTHLQKSWRTESSAAPSEQTLGKPSHGRSYDNNGHQKGKRGGRKGNKKPTGTTAWGGTTARHHQQQETTAAPPHDTAGGSSMPFTSSYFAPDVGSASNHLAPYPTTLPPVGGDANLPPRPAFGFGGGACEPFPAYQDVMTHKEHVGGAGSSSGRGANGHAPTASEASTIILAGPSNAASASASASAPQPPKKTQKRPNKKKNKNHENKYQDNKNQENMSSTAGPSSEMASTQNTAVKEPMENTQRPPKQPPQPQQKQQHGKGDQPKDYKGKHAG